MFKADGLCGGSTQSFRVQRLLKERWLVDYSYTSAYYIGMDLPSPKEMELMAIIAFAEMSGREIAKAYEREAKRSISYGTLYTTLRRLERQNWVRTRDDVDSDGRLKFFRLTNAGKNALSSARYELSRLANFGLNYAQQV